MVREAPTDAREIVWNTRGEDGTYKLREYAYRPYLQGGSLTMSPDGAKLFAVSEDRGALDIVNPGNLEVEKSIAVCARPEQVVVAADGRKWVSCRGDEEVVALDENDAVVARRSLPEPFGIALTPAGDRVLVTTTAPAGIVALASSDLEIAWRRALPAGPRGVAVSAAGDRAAVAHLGADSVSVVDVATGKMGGAALPATRDGWLSELFNTAPPASHGKRRVAGGAFAVAASPGGTRAFVPYLLRNDGAEIEDFIPGCYANGADLPLAASVAAVDLLKGHVLRPAPVRRTSREELYADFGKVAEMGHLGVVRAAFHDPVRSRLFAVGEGSGLLVSFDTSKADPTAAPLSFVALGAPANGLVVDPRGERVFAHLGLQDELVAVDLATQEVTKATLGKSELDERVALGRTLFHTANDGRLTRYEGLSCSSCHLDGRSDGITWRLDGKPLQTPNLAGRDFPSDQILRWHGDSPELTHAVGQAIERLSGTGLAESDAEALAVYLRSREMEMAPHAATLSDDAAERGRAVFAEAGCDNCHRADSDYSDGLTHTFRNGDYRTPSLRGLASTAPYYHDGSAPSLAALLRSNEKHNPMAVGKKLDGRQIADLEAFLRSL